MTLMDVLNICNNDNICVIVETMDGMALEVADADIRREDYHAVKNRIRELSRLQNVVTSLTCTEINKQNIIIMVPVETSNT